MKILLLALAITSIISTISVASVQHDDHIRAITAVMHTPHITEPCTLGTGTYALRHAVAVAQGDITQ